MAAEGAWRRSRAAIESDLNTAGALAAIFDLVREVNAAVDARQVSARDAARGDARPSRTWTACWASIGLRRAEDAKPPVPVDEIEQLIDDRRAARQRRDFAAADAIRVGAGRPRRPARGRARGHALEAEVATGLAGQPWRGACTS